MLAELIQEQRRSLDAYFQQLDLPSVERVVQLCLHTEGLLIFTGVGKSGIIAEKIAATLISTGTRALYLPPTNFLHGDMGILSPKDLFIVISRSGETEELLNLVPFAKGRKTPFLAITSNPSSRLARLSDHQVHLPFERELCPFDLAPTTSTAVQLLFGDLLAIALMRKKGLSLDAYAQNHPSGAIGKRASLTVDDLMFKGEAIPLVTPERRLIDVLVELSNKKCGALLVAQPDKTFLGIFTDGDLRRSLQTRGEEVLLRTMGELMTPTALSIERGALAWEALKIMQKDPKKFVTVLPVLDAGKVTGILRMHCIIQAGLS